MSGGITTAEAVTRAGGSRPVCSCHGEPQYWRKDGKQVAGGRWVCAVRARSDKKAIYDADPNGERSRAAERDADRLIWGARIPEVNRHHRAIAVIKARRGDPRPEGMTLSLVDADSPTTYLGYNIYNGEHRPYLLDTNPDNYAWESHADNMKRGQPARGMHRG